MRSSLLGFLAGLSVAVVAYVLIHHHPFLPKLNMEISPPPQANSPVIPHCEDLVLDGKAETWSSRGLYIDLLQDENLDWNTKEPFVARARLAWTSQDLLIRIEADVKATQESNDDNILWTGDNIDVALGIGEDSHLICHFLVAPGLDPKHPKMRVQTQDIPYLTQNLPPYTYETSSYPCPAKITSQRTATGYAVEYTIPWSVYGVTPANGQSCALRLHAMHINNAGADKAGGWVPLDIYPYAKGMALGNKVYFTLGDTPSTPIHAMASLKLLMPQLLEVSYFTSPPAKGRTLILEANGKEIDRFVSSDTKPADIHIITLPSTDSDGKLNLLVRDGDQILCEYTADEYTSAVNDYYHSLKFRMATVFGISENPDLPKDKVKNKLPGGDFEQKVLVRYMLGAPVSKIHYYDANYNEVTAAPQAGRYGAIVDIHFPDGLDVQKFFTLYRAAGRLPWGSNALPLTLQQPSLGIDAAVLNNYHPSDAEGVHYTLFSGYSDSENLAIVLAGLSDISHGKTSSGGWANPRIMNLEWWDGLRQKLGNPQTYQYITNLPAEYDADPNKRWPLILFLHGSGERGDVLSKIRINGLAKLLYQGKKIPAVVISPQCPANEDWNHAVLSRLLDEVGQKYRIDPDRIYVTGLSMGGFGSWDLAMAYPNRFAAIAPIAADADPADAPRVKNLPIWIFHGGADEPSQATNMYAAIRKVGGTHAHLTIYPGIGHWSWDFAYTNDDFYTWLFAQKRGQPEVVTPGLPK